MSQEVVRALVNGVEANVSRGQAQRKGWTVLEDEPTTRPDGSQRPETRPGGRPAKPKTSVSSEAEKKKAAAKSAEPAESDNPPS